MLFMQRWWYNIYIKWTVNRMPDMSFSPPPVFVATFKAQAVRQILASNKFKTARSNSLDRKAAQKLFNYDFESNALELQKLGYTIELLEKLANTSITQIESIQVPIEYIKFLNLFLQRN